MSRLGVRVCQWHVSDVDIGIADRQRLPLSKNAVAVRIAPSTKGSDRIEISLINRLTGFYGYYAGQSLGKEEV